MADAGPIWRARFRGERVFDVVEGERQLSVQVADRAPLTVARAVEAALGRTMSGEPRLGFHSIHHDHGGPFQLERTTFTFVVDVVSRCPLMVFSSEEDFGTYPDWDQPKYTSGVVDVLLATSGEDVIVARPDEIICVRPTPESEAEAREVWRRYERLPDEPVSDDDDDDDLPAWIR
jgi:hypothetical protein